MEAVSAKPEASTIRGRRRRLGISQQALAVAAGCSVSSVRLFEAGFDPEHSPTRSRVEGVLDELEARNGQPSGQHLCAAAAVAGGSHALAGCDRPQHERPVGGEQR